MHHHIEPMDDSQEHITSPDCPCRPVLKVWVHRSFDGREMDEEGHTIGIPALIAEYLVFYTYYLHGISKARCVEILSITPEAFDIRYEQFLERYKTELMDQAAELLCPPGN